MPLISSVSTQHSKILCCYFNSTNLIQIIKVLEHKSYSLEKIIFPQQRILFESTLLGQIEIYQPQGQQILKKTVPCTSIRQEQSKKKLATV